MIICETKRLLIRHFQLDDAAYVLRQLNEQSFIDFIADKKIRDLEGAKNYLKNGPLKSYRTYGFGLNIVLTKDSEIPLGMCGLVKREELKNPDLGYAFLPEFWGKGYATEASQAVLQHGIKILSLNTILGITLPNNDASNRLLQKLGFIQKGTLEYFEELNNLYEYKKIQ